MATANLIQTSVSGRTQNALAAQGDGFILPKVSSINRLALTLTTSDAGLQVYDTTTGSVYVWDGTAWTAPIVTYTQGIWSPAFTPTTGTITLNPAFTTGLWSRIGNTVTVVGRFKVLSVNSPTGLLTLTNLPYPVVAGFESAACVSATGLNNGARTAISGTIFGLGVEVYHYDSGTLQNMAVHVLAGSDWYVSGTYITA
jgi:hypothetical protein